MDDVLVYPDQPFGTAFQMVLETRHYLKITYLHFTNFL